MVSPTRWQFMPCSNLQLFWDTNLNKALWGCWSFTNWVSFEKCFVAVYSLIRKCSKCWRFVGKYPSCEKTKQCNFIRFITSVCCKTCTEMLWIVTTLIFEKASFWINESILLNSLNVKSVRKGQKYKYLGLSHTLYQIKFIISS